MLKYNQTTFAGGDMNTAFNIRYQSTEEKIERALFNLLRIRNFNDIYIKEICYEAGINRSSFYAHYQDINDLMIKTEERLSAEINKIFVPNKVYRHEDFVKLFEFLYSKRDFYNAYLSQQDQFMVKNDFIGYLKRAEEGVIRHEEYNSRDLYYHMAFFSGGLLALTKFWIQRGCEYSPEKMAQIIFDQYKNNSKYFEEN